MINCDTGLYLAKSLMRLKQALKLSSKKTAAKLGERETLLNIQ